MSKIKDGAAIRKERINLLLDIITKNPEASENKVKGIFMLKTGLTMKTIGDYVEELILVEIVQRDGDKLSTFS
jgi:predicted transcriptional regulator